MTTKDFLFARQDQVLVHQEKEFAGDATNRGLFPIFFSCHRKKFSPLNFFSPTILQALIILAKVSLKQMKEHDTKQHAVQDFRKLSTRHRDLDPGRRCQKFFAQHPVLLKHYVVQEKVHRQWVSAT